MTLPKYGQVIVQVDLDVVTDALGALTDAAASGDPTNVDTAMAYLKQIINTLEGTAGIPAFPAAAAPANGVSLAEVLREVYDLVAAGSLALPRVTEKVIYPVAEHLSTTELDDDGSSPAFTADTVQTTAAAISEATAEAAWLEEIDYEQQGTLSLISIFAYFEWQTRFVNNAGAGTNSISKVQISRDGGVTWVDLTDNFTNPAVAYTNRTRAGVGLWITGIDTGADELQFRLVHWTDDGTGVDRSDAQIRANSYVRITERKS